MVSSGMASTKHVDDQFGTCFRNNRLVSKRSGELRGSSHGQKSTQAKAMDNRSVFKQPAVQQIQAILKTNGYQIEKDEAKAFFAKRQRMGAGNSLVAEESFKRQHAAEDEGANRRMSEDDACSRVGFGSLPKLSVGMSRLGLDRHWQGLVLDQGGADGRVGRPCGRHGEGRRIGGAYAHMHSMNMSPCIAQ